MNQLEVGVIMTMTETIPGYPSKFGEEHEEMFWLSLQDVPSNLLPALKLRLATATERPSPGQIREWAADASPRPQYQPPQLECSAPELSSMDDVMALFEGKTHPKNQPQIARDIMANYRRVMAEDAKLEKQGKKRPYATIPAAGKGDHGLKYAYCNGKVEYFPARWTKAEAQTEADRRQARMVGVTITTYHVSAVSDNATGSARTGDIPGAVVIDPSTLPDKPKPKWDGTRRRSRAYSGVRED
jgi:hypothetical protein